MSILLRGTGVVLSFILVTGILSAKELPTTFGERLQAGMISTDPAQWDAETRKEFFGNLPPEFHQKYLDIYAKLREANREYWKTRAELFGVIHPLLIKEIEQSIGELEKSIKEWENREDSDYLRGVLQTDLDQYKEIRGGDYSTIAKRYTDLHTTGYLHTIWNEFRQYPEYLDPKKQAEYWNALAEENLFPYEQIVGIIQQKIEKQKRQIGQYQGRIDNVTHTDFPTLPQVLNVHRGPIDKITLKNLPSDLNGGSGAIRAFSVAGTSNNILSLDNKRKSQIIGDEPFTGSSDFGYIHVWPYPRFKAYELLKESRDAEREPWRFYATMELKKLEIKQAEVDRRDGSLSLHPFIRAIAERCGGIDTACLQTTITHTPAAAGKHITLSNTHQAILAVIKGEKDITFSTRRLSKMEMNEAEKLGVELVQIPFAKDAFVFLQNRLNPVRNLTLEQYQGIFSGKYPNWKDVGGFGGVIKPFIRNAESGSEELMQTLVMKDIPVHENFKPKRMDTMSGIFEELQGNPTGIAYSIYHYDRYMVFNPGTRVMAVNGAFPTTETIASGEYPLVYETVLVHRKNPGEKVERFVRWLLSEEGHKLARSVGYVPIAGKNVQ